MRKKKRLFQILGLAVVSLALTECAVQEVEMAAPAGINFEVFATPTDTRTVNSGLYTQWESGDKFNLFHAKAGSATFTADGAFTVDDEETGHATGTVTSAVTAASDWYMVYPYASGSTSPKAASVKIGATAGAPQVQAEADDMTHLAGSAFPLAGKAAAVAAGVTPTLPVAPIVSVLAVNLTNPGEGTAHISSIRFKAPEAIVGTFQVDITGENPVFTPVSASDEALLSIPGGAPLAKGENSVFYLGIKPFTAPAGATISLTVNDEVHSLTLTRPFTFAPGKIKALNLTLDPSDPDDEGTYYFKRVSSFSPGKKYLLVAAETDENEEVQLRMAQAMPAGTTSGRLYCVDVEETDGVITLSSQADAFTFYESENGTLIRQADGRYLYNSNSDYNVRAGTEPNSGYYWTITFGAEGEASIVNRARQLKYNTTSSVRAFQTRKTTESGLLVRLYELQNSDDAVAEFIQKTTPGVYAYEGSDWLYEDGSMQLSIRTGGGGTAFRIYEPATFTVIQVTGIPEAVAENDVFNIRLARYVKQAATHISNLSAKVVHLEDGKAWLMAGNGTGLIVCLQ